MAIRLQNESFSLSLTLPDLVVTEEILPTTTGGDAIEQVVFAAREASAWASNNNILATDYMLKVEGVDYFITQLHLALHRVRVLQVCMKTFVVPLKNVSGAEQELNAFLRSHRVASIWGWRPSGSNRVNRGGSWNNPAGNCRCSRSR